MREQPLVSVIVPCYNHEKYIKICIESIVNQSYKNIELIVIDDGSTDSSPTILLKLQEEYNFKLEIQSNIGVANTLNKGIQKYATGDYVTFCASDDFWLLDKLEKQVEFMETNPACPMCFGKVIVVDEKGIERKDKTLESNLGLKGGDVFRDILLINFHPPVTYFFRKNIFEEVGYYKSNIWTEDFYMNLRLSEKYPLGFIDEYLSYYRLPMVKGNDGPNIRMITSHLECIDLYKDSEYYQEALKNWHYKNFRMFSGYKASKGLAAMGMLKNLGKFYQLGFLKSVVKLIIVWH